MEAKTNRKRKKHTEEFKREAVRLLERTGDYWEVHIARYQLAAALYRLGEFREAVHEARLIHLSGLDLGDIQASGISLDVWARASRGKVRDEAVQREVARERRQVGHVQAPFVVPFPIPMVA